MSVTYAPLLETTPRRDLTRWLLCFVIILLAHAVGVMALLRYRDDGGEPPGGPPAILLELAPLPAAPAAVTPTDAPPGPLQTQTAEPPAQEKLERLPEPEQPPPVQEEAKPAEEPPVMQAEAPPLEPPPLEPPPPVIPDLAPAPNPEVAIAVPPPEVKRRDEPKPEPKPVEKKREKPKPRPQSAPATTAPAASARPARPAPARVATAASSASMPAWKAQLAAHLQRFKRYPAEAQARGEQGVAMLHFTIDRSGRVLSSRLSRSSGIASLDRETLSLAQRAQPFPRPPADVAGRVFPFDVPIRFSVR